MAKQALEAAIVSLVGVAFELKHVLVEIALLDKGRNLQVITFTLRVVEAFRSDELFAALLGGVKVLKDRPHLCPSTDDTGYRFTSVCHH